MFHYGERDSAFSDKNAARTLPFLYDGSSIEFSESAALYNIDLTMTEGTDDQTEIVFGESRQEEPDSLSTRVRRTLALSTGKREGVSTSSGSNRKKRHPHPLFLRSLASATASQASSVNTSIGRTENSNYNHRNFNNRKHQGSGENAPGSTGSHSHGESLSSKIPYLARTQRLQKRPHLLEKTTQEVHGEHEPVSTNRSSIEVLRWKQKIDEDSTISGLPSMPIPIVETIYSTDSSWNVEDEMRLREITKGVDPELYGKSEEKINSTKSTQGAYVRSLSKPDGDAPTSRTAAVSSKPEGRNSQKLPQIFSDLTIDEDIMTTAGTTEASTAPSVLTHSDLIKIRSRRYLGMGASKRTGQPGKKPNSFQKTMADSPPSRLVKQAIKSTESKFSLVRAKGSSRSDTKQTDAEPVGKETMKLANDSPRQWQLRPQQTNDGATRPSHKYHSQQGAKAMPTRTTTCDTFNFPLSPSGKMTSSKVECLTPQASTGPPGTQKENGHKEQDCRNLEDSSTFELSRKISDRLTHLSRMFHERKQKSNTNLHPTSKVESIGMTVAPPSVSTIPALKNRKPSSTVSARRQRKGRKSPIESSAKASSRADKERSQHLSPESIVLEDVRVDEETDVVEVVRVLSVSTHASNDSRKLSQADGTRGPSYERELSEQDNTIVSVADNREIDDEEGSEAGDESDEDALNDEDIDSDVGGDDDANGLSSGVLPSRSQASASGLILPKIVSKLPPHVHKAKGGPVSVSGTSVSENRKLADSIYEKAVQRTVSKDQAPQGLALAGTPSSAFVPVNLSGRPPSAYDKDCDESLMTSSLNPEEPFDIISPITMNTEQFEVTRPRQHHRHPVHLRRYNHKKHISHGSNPMHKQRPAISGDGDNDRISKFEQHLTSAAEKITADLTTRGIMEQLVSGHFGTETLESSWDDSIAESLESLSVNKVRVAVKQKKKELQSGSADSSIGDRGYSVVNTNNSKHDLRQLKDRLQEILRIESRSKRQSALDELLEFDTHSQAAMTQALSDIAEEQSIKVSLFATSSNNIHVADSKVTCNSSSRGSGRERNAVRKDINTDAGSNCFVNSFSRDNAKSKSNIHQRDPDGTRASALINAITNRYRHMRQNQGKMDPDEEGPSIAKSNQEPDGESAVNFPQHDLSPTEVATSSFHTDATLSMDESRKTNDRHVPTITRRQPSVGLSCAETLASAYPEDVSGVTSASQPSQGFGDSKSRCNVVLTSSDRLVDKSRQEATKDVNTTTRSRTHSESESTTKSNRIPKSMGTSNDPQRLKPESVSVSIDVTQLQPLSSLSYGDESRKVVSGATQSKEWPLLFLAEQQPASSLPEVPNRVQSLDAPPRTSHNSKAENNVSEESQSISSTTMSQQLPVFSNRPSNMDAQLSIVGQPRTSLSHTTQPNVVHTSVFLSKGPLNEFESKPLRPGAFKVVPQEPPKQENLTGNYPAHSGNHSHPHHWSNRHLSASLMSRRETLDSMALESPKGAGILQSLSAAREKTKVHFFSRKEGAKNELGYSTGRDPEGNDFNHNYAPRVEERKSHECTSMAPKLFASAEAGEPTKPCYNSVLSNSGDGSSQKNPIDLEVERATTSASKPKLDDLFHKMGGIYTSARHTQQSGSSTSREACLKKVKQQEEITFVDETESGVIHVKSGVEPTGSHSRISTKSSKLLNHTFEGENYPASSVEQEIIIIEDEEHAPDADNDIPDKIIPLSPIDFASRGDVTSPCTTCTVGRSKSAGDGEGVPSIVFASDSFSSDESQKEGIRQKKNENYKKFEITEALEELKAKEMSSCNYKGIMMAIHDISIDDTLSFNSTDDLSINQSLFQKERISTHEFDKVIEALSEVKVIKSLPQRTHSKEYPASSSEKSLESSCNPRSLDPREGGINDHRDPPEVDQSVDEDSDDDINRQISRRIQALWKAKDTKPGYKKAKSPSQRNCLQRHLSGSETAPFDQNQKDPPEIEKINKCTRRLNTSMLAEADVSSFRGPRTRLQHKAKQTSDTSDHGETRTSKKRKTVPFDEDVNLSTQKCTPSIDSKAMPRGTRDPPTRGDSLEDMASTPSKKSGDPPSRDLSLKLKHGAAASVLRNARALIASKRTNRSSIPTDETELSSASSLYRERKRDEPLADKNDEFEPSHTAQSLRAQDNLPQSLSISKIASHQDSCLHQNESENNGKTIQSLKARRDNIRVSSTRSSPAIGRSVLSFEELADPEFIVRMDTGQQIKRQESNCESSGEFSTFKNVGGGSSHTSNDVMGQNLPLVQHHSQEPVSTDYGRNTGKDDGKARIAQFLIKSNKPEYRTLAYEYEKAVKHANDGEVLNDESFTGEMPKLFSFGTRAKRNAKRKNDESRKNVEHDSDGHDTGFSRPEAVEIILSQAEDSFEDDKSHDGYKKETFDKPQQTSFDSGLKDKAFYNIKQPDKAVGAGTSTSNSNAHSPGDGLLGMILQVRASEDQLPPRANDRGVQKALRDFSVPDSEKKSCLQKRSSNASPLGRSTPKTLQYKTCSETTDSVRNVESDEQIASYTKQAEPNFKRERSKHSKSSYQEKVHLFKQKLRAASKYSIVGNEIVANTKRTGSKVVSNQEEDVAIEPIRSLLGVKMNEIVAGGQEKQSFPKQEDSKISIHQIGKKVKPFSRLNKPLRLGKTQARNTLNLPSNSKKTFDDESSKASTDSSELAGDKYIDMDLADQTIFKEKMQIVKEDIDLVRSKLGRKKHSRKIISSYRRDDSMAGEIVKQAYERNDRELVRDEHEVNLHAQTDSFSLPTCFDPKRSVDGTGHYRNQEIPSLIVSSNDSSWNKKDTARSPRGKQVDQSGNSEIDFVKASERAEQKVREGLEKMKKGLADSKKIKLSIEKLRKKQQEDTVKEEAVNTTSNGVLDGFGLFSWLKH